MTPKTQDLIRALTELPGVVSVRQAGDRFRLEYPRHLGGMIYLTRPEAKRAIDKAATR